MSSEKELINIWKDYLRSHPEDDASLRELMFSVGLSKIYDILKNARGRKIEIRNTLDLQNHIDWRYV